MSFHDKKEKEEKWAKSEFEKDIKSPAEISLAHSHLFRFPDVFKLLKKRIEKCIPHSFH